MMGPQQVAQGALFYEFSIEDHVPADHLLRRIDRFVDLSGIRCFLGPFYSATGRPSIDPELMIRMLIVGYCFGIRSERRLCEEVHLNLAYRWFCRLDLGDPVPDHSTFSKNRHGRFRDSDLFRRLLEDVLAGCIAEGLVRGDSFGVDASIIKAERHDIDPMSQNPPMLAQLRCPDFYDDGHEATNVLTERKIPVGCPASVGGSRRSHGPMQEGEGERS
jgi:transposase